MNDPLFIGRNDEAWASLLGAAAEEQKRERKEGQRGEAEGRLQHKQSP
jgi:hypothetical protein